MFSLYFLERFTLCQPCSLYLLRRFSPGGSWGSLDMYRIMEIKRPWKGLRGWVKMNERMWQCDAAATICDVTLGLFTKGTNHVPKAVLERDSDPFLIWKSDFNLCERKALSNQAFETHKKRAFWIVIHAESLILRTCERKALSEHDSSVHILEMCAEAMHGSICEVGAKYYLAVRRSCSWSGRRLQCMWTHVVKITNPIRKRMAIRNSFRNMIPSFVNRPNVILQRLYAMWQCDFAAIVCDVTMRLCSDCMRCDNVTMQRLYVMWQVSLSFTCQKTFDFRRGRTCFLLMTSKLVYDGAREQI